MRRTATFGLMMTLVAVLLPIALSAPQAQAQAAQVLPGGRSTYVVSVMGGTNLHMYSKLAMYLFSTNGTVTQRYWYWRQDQVSGYSNSVHTKLPSGYTTSGCRYACPVRTPVGFQKGVAPKTMTGTWRIDSYKNLYVKWTATAWETWRVNSSQPGFTALTAMTAYNSQRIQRGWAFGSNWSPDSGVSMAKVHASVRLLGPLAHNYYGVPTQVLQQGFYFPNYQKCSNGTCLQSMENTSSDKRKWYHSYFAGNPAADGRKTYWNSQTGSVQQSENPAWVCIGYGGGHTSAALQVIDDSGNFRGLVGAEASLDRQAYAMAQVSAWVDVLPPMLPTLSSLN